MKQYFLPNQIGRFGFLIFSFISLIIFGLCILVQDGAVMGFAVLVPMYMIHALARVRDWKGRVWLWALIIASICWVVGVGIVDQFVLNQKIASIDLSTRVTASMAAAEKGQPYMPTEQGYIADDLEVGLWLFAFLHLWLQFKKGTKPSASYQKIKKGFLGNLQERLELWRLRGQKRKLVRQAEIEQLRKEVSKRSDSA